MEANVALSAGSSKLQVELGNYHLLPGYYLSSITWLELASIHLMTSRYLTFGREHKFLFAFQSSISTPRKSRHSVVQNSTELYRKETLAAGMFDVSSKFQCRNPRFSIIFDTLCLARGGLCLTVADSRFMKCKLIGVKDDPVHKSIRFLQAMWSIKSSF